MSYFQKGFEKAAEANGLIGSAPHLASGNRTKVKGEIVPLKPPKPGIVRAPRSEMPDLGTMAAHDERHNLSAILPFKEAPKVRIPKP